MGTNVMKLTGAAVAPVTSAQSCTAQKLTAPTVDPEVAMVLSGLRPTANFRDYGFRRGELVHVGVDETTLDTYALFDFVLERCQYEVEVVTRRYSVVDGKIAFKQYEMRDLHPDAYDAQRAAFAND